MSSRICPDWPLLLELAPELQFKHYTVSEAQLPVEVVTALTAVSLSEVAVCADLGGRVFYGEHTEREVADALRAAGWREVRDSVAAA
jgi:hypothetical protein